MRHLILDTETTGFSFLSGDRVIEVAVVEYVNAKATGKMFYALINPDRDIPAASTAVHGYTNAHVKDSPRFRDVAAEFVEFCRGAKVVAHNAPFDMGFLDNELELAGRPERMTDLVDEVIDSLRVARALHPKQSQKTSLDALLVLYGVDASSRDAGHNARVDCALLGEVFFKMNESMDVSQLNLSSPEARRPITRVSRPAQLPRVVVLDEEVAQETKVLDAIAAGGVQPVARRARM